MGNLEELRVTKWARCKAVIDKFLNTGDMGKLVYFYQSVFRCGYTWCPEACQYRPFRECQRRHYCGFANLLQRCAKDGKLVLPVFLKTADGWALSPAGLPLNINSENLKEWFSNSINTALALIEFTALRAAIEERVKPAVGCEGAQRDSPTPTAIAGPKMGQSGKH